MASTSTCSSFVNGSVKRSRCLSVSRSAPVCRVRRAWYSGSLVKPRCPWRSCWTRRRHRVQGVPGEADDVERVHDSDRGREFLGRCGLESGEPVHRDHFDGASPHLGSVGEPGLERRLGAALDHVQQPCWAGPVPDRGEVDDDGDELSPLRVCRHTCSSTPMTATPSNPVWSQIRTRLPSARTASFAVFQATPSPSATRATVKC